MRRIVMGTDNNSGGPRTLSDKHLVPVTVSILPGVEVYRVWELDGAPELPETGLPDEPNGQYIPPAGGVRFGFLTVPPGLSYETPPGTTEAQLIEGMTEMEGKIPGLAATFDPERPGTHTTPTVDFIVAVFGSGRMVAADGIEIRMEAGDCLIQNGTPHAWYNDGPVPFVIAYSLYGAAS